MPIPWPLVGDGRRSRRWCASQANWERYRGSGFYFREPPSKNLKSIMIAKCLNLTKIFTPEFGHRCSFLSSLKKNHKGFFVFRSMNMAFLCRPSSKPYIGISISAHTFFFVVLSPCLRAGSVPRRDAIRLGVWKLFARDLILLAVCMPG